VGDLIHTLFGNAGANFLPYFNELLEHIDKMLVPYPERTHFDHQLAISIFDDLVEYCGPKSFEYIDHFGEAMCIYLMDANPELRQACAYGIGVCAMHGGEAYTPMVASVLGNLTEMIGDAESRSLENKNATENAISAIFKAVVHLPGCGYSLDETLPQILDWLPIVSDEEEAKYMYTELCQQLEGGNAVLMQPENLMKLFMIFAEVLGDKKIAPLKPDADAVGYVPVDFPLQSLRVRAVCVCVRARARVCGRRRARGLVRTSSQAFVLTLCSGAPPSRFL
jgi:hypothetical protein